MQNEIVNTGLDLKTSTDVKEFPVMQSDVEVKKGNSKKIALFAVFGIIGLGLLFILGSYVWSKYKPADLILTVPTKKIKVQTNNQLSTGLIISKSTMGAVLSDVPFTDLKSGFEINAPVGWKIDSSKKAGANVMILNPEMEPTGDTRFATFISVTVGETPGITLNDQVEVVKKSISVSSPTYVFDDDRDTYLSGRVYHLLSGYYLVDGVKIRNRNIITIYNNRGYAISATGPDSIWAKNETIMVTSMYSFKLI